LGEPLLLRVLWGNDPRRFRARLQAGYVVSTFKSAVVELPPERDCEADRSNCAPLTLVILPYLLPATSSRTRRTFLFKPSLCVCLQYRHATRTNITRHDDYISARLAPFPLISTLYHLTLSNFTSSPLHAMLLMLLTHSIQAWATTEAQRRLEESGEWEKIKYKPSGSEGSVGV
jgi:hypothetical protein